MDYPETPKTDVKSEQLILTPLQQKLLITSAKAQEINEKHLLLLEKEKISLNRKMYKLKKDEKIILFEVSLLESMIASDKKTFKDLYTETIRLIVKEHGIHDPPWEASTVLNNNLPVAIELHKLPKHSEKIKS